MIDTNGAAPVAAPDAPSAPVQPAPDFTRPRLIEPVPITLDKERTLRMPLWALYAFEKATGLNPLVFEGIWTDDTTLDTLTALLWAALLHEDRSLTLQQVREMDAIEMGNILYIRNRLAECFGKNMPDPEPATNGTAKGPKASRSPG